MLFDILFFMSNILEVKNEEQKHLIASGLMGVFKKIWGVEAWSGRMEYILNNAILALLEVENSTLLGTNRMFSDKEYRKHVVSQIEDPLVKSFWVDEFGKYTERFAAEATPAIQNKVGQFTSNALMRNIIGQPKSSFDIREIMDTRKILIINLSKGRVGESNANLLGSMLITKIYLAAMSRSDVPPSTMQSLPNFYLYVDEFQSFANRSFADILSEARKYKLNLTIAHQYVEQMSEEVRAAVFGNVGTMISFRVGAFDSEILEKEFAPTFTAEDLVNLGFIQMYLKLMIDGVSSAPFSATSLPPIEAGHESFKEKVTTFSREHYGKPRTLVEEKIKQWHEPINSAPASKSKTKKEDIVKKPLQNKTELPPLTEDQLKQTQILKKTSPRPAGLGLGEAPKPQPQLQSRQQPQKTVSLNDLKPTNIATPKIRKEPSKENRLDLRNALASVMKEKAPDKSKENLSDTRRNLNYISEPSVRPVKTIEDTGTTLDKFGSQEIPKGPQKEVPEKVLRKILSVDDKLK